jgi:hypothetical protein
MKAFSMLPFLAVLPKKVYGEMTKPEAVLRLMTYNDSDLSAIWLRL